MTENSIFGIPGNEGRNLPHNDLHLGHSGRKYVNRRCHRRGQELLRQQKTFFPLPLHLLQVLSANF